MQSAHGNENLLDAMVLLEIANNMYPEAENFFSKYSTSDLIRSAHDLVQRVYSNMESPLDSDTREVLATLEAARTYMDRGGHLLKDPESAEKNKKMRRKRPFYAEYSQELGFSCDGLTSTSSGPIFRRGCASKPAASHGVKPSPLSPERKGVKSLGKPCLPLSSLPFSAENERANTRGVVSSGEGAGRQSRRGEV